ncbi:unnamed protein product [Cyprideis torosa]|uniref:Uncharacterized protein n=1 Tax=Cyprideis torosa TaxID=163714 RepID=A0A7R8ZH39_9CRUS|nr:unnamed protein product [Cyprideis torosa]CAG0882786.1 unnamed protein product [Cyprideis torosa]
MDFPVLFFVFGFISLSHCGPHSPESRAFCTDCELCSGTFSKCEAQCAANDQFPVRLMEESDQFWICTSPLELESECAEDSECQLSVPSSVCRNGKCACKPGTVRGNQTLCIQPVLGGPCPEDMACSSFIANSHCNETSMCACVEGTTAAFTNMSCITPGLGISCPAYPKKCSDFIGNSVCSNRTSTCTCLLGYVEGMDGSCTSAGNGEMCPKYVTCNDFILNSVCHKETWTCSCGVNMAPDLNNVCVNVQLGMPCPAAQNCSSLIPNSQCDSATDTCECKDGFQEATSKCVRCLEGGVVNLSTNKCYYLKTVTGIKWDQARDFCLSDGMHLVSIHSAAENTFVHNLAGVSWIGLNDVATEGEFVWSDGSPTNYANWKASEPNNYDGIEDCGVIDADGKWNDFPCHYGKSKFVCTGSIVGDAS